MTLFVYPMYNYGRKVFRIQRECEDGYCWADIKDYLKDYELDIKNVTWRVTVNPVTYESVVIQANTVEGWYRQFEALDVIWSRAFDRR